MQVSTILLEIKNHSNFIELITDAAKFQMFALTDDILRIRCSFERDFAKDSSYSLIMTAWEDEMDHVIKDRTRVTPLLIDLQELDEYYTWSSNKLVVKIYKAPFAIVIEDMNGQLLHQDIANKSYVQDELGRKYHYSSLQDDDYYYGFGEKSGQLNKKNRRLRMHNVDTIGYNSESTDPLYKHIPFYIKFNSKQRTASGMFYHNTYNSNFDVGSERSGYWPKYSYYSTEGGELDYFFINGPTIKEVVKRYTDLTGKSILTPKYSLGYLGSTMFYTELETRSDEAIIGFLDKCKAEGIPCDGFFMSSGYTTGEDGKRYVFNWNYDRFPDPAAFVQSTEQHGATLSPNIKPGMLLTHPLYKEFAEKQLFVKDENNDQPVIDRYWGGPASFVDFTNPEAREQWKGYVKHQLLDHGVTAIWNDNNEYEIQQSNAQCHYEGLGKPISALSSVMPNLMALTAVEAIQEHDKNIRPYVVNRAGYAGIQRYAQTWAGDNLTSWNSLKFNIPLILGLGLSGVANQGCDIGGFYGPAPEPELFVRWVQNGIFQPRFSIHSSNTDNTVTEPWMYPSYTKYIRDAISLRYELVPYFYSLLYESSTIGSPMMRPLVYEFENDPQVWDESFEFMLGSSILVANVVDPGVTTHRIYLPSGSDWIEWKSKKRYAGGETIEIPVQLDSIPMFIRSGGIIPLAHQLNNIHHDKINHLKLLIEGSNDGTFVYYDDDGKSLSYTDKQYLKTDISLQVGNESTISFQSEGDFISSIETYEIQFICKDVSPVTITLGNHIIQRYLDEDQWKQSQYGWYFNIEQKTAQIKYNNPHCDHTIKIDFSVKDLISI